MTKQYTAEDFKVGDFWETRSGAKHLIISNLPSLNVYYPIIAIKILGAEAHGKSRVYIFEYAESGKYSSQERQSRHDLIRPWREKKRVKGWLNIYAHSDNYMQTYGLYSTKQTADHYARVDRFGCIYIDVEEGEGLETETDNA